jgi:DNA (cytosine-5)-methyltransferase 1
MNVVSLFAGCGGSSEGWKQAGFDVPVAVELDTHAVEIYRSNAPGAVVIDRDIATVTGDEIRGAAGLDEFDVLDGSPPCQAFSMAGKRELGADEKGRGMLFREYVRLVRDLRPRVFVAENVDGMTVGAAKVTVARVMCDLKACGYSVHAKVLSADRLGVPQTRRRLFIVGARHDTGVDVGALFPMLSDARTTIGDALPHVTRFVRLGRPLTSTAHWRGEESWPADAPGPTMTAGGLGNSRFDDVRVETIDGELRRPMLAELLAYSGFRPDFSIEGTFGKQWERLGNSVPPPMMRAVAKKVGAALRSSSTNTAGSR